MYNAFTTATVNADLLEQPVDYQRLLLPSSSSAPFFQPTTPLFPSSAQDYPELFYNYHFYTGTLQWLTTLELI